MQGGTLLPRMRSPRCSPCGPNATPTNHEVDGAQVLARSIRHATGVPCSLRPGHLAEIARRSAYTSSSGVKRNRQADVTAIASKRLALVSGSGRDDRQHLGNTSGVWECQSQRYPTLTAHPAVAPRADVPALGTAGVLGSEEPAANAGVVFGPFGRVGFRHEHVAIGQHVSQRGWLRPRAKAVTPRPAAGRGACVPVQPTAVTTLIDGMRDVSWAGSVGVRPNPSETARREPELQAALRATSRPNTTDEIADRMHCSEHNAHSARWSRLPRPRAGGASHTVRFAGST